jgi:hypothetical protein
MAATGVSRGYQPGPAYRPAAPVTRGAMSAFLFRLAGQTVDPGDLPATPTFRDVGRTHTFFAEIEWMASSGIATGHPDGTFRSTAVVSRQAMSAFLFRASGQDAPPRPPQPTFHDVSLQHPFVAEIEWMADQGISTGYPSTNGPIFRPAAAVTRQAMSAFLHRFDSAFPSFGEA